MKNRNATLTLVLLCLLLFVFVLRRWKEPVEKEAVNRNPAHLTFTRHALCRMGCRHISEGEIKEIIQRGIINFNKSNKRDRPCPTYAMQGRTSGGESLRVVFAQCATETKVITCYNLEEEFSCHCPGDENKN